jgi:hypothetical protein
MPESMKPLAEVPAWPLCDLSALMIESGRMVGDYWDGKTGVAEIFAFWPRKENGLLGTIRMPTPKTPAAKEIPGAKSRVEEALVQALHATNVQALLGSGASLCTRNKDDRQAPGMKGRTTLALKYFSWLCRSLCWAGSCSQPWIIGSRICYSISYDPYPA